MHPRKVVRLVLLLVVAAACLYGIHRTWSYLREHAYDNDIRAVAARHGVSPYLVKAVVWRESKFRRLSIGRAGEVGLMQVMPAAAQEWAAAQGRRSPSRAELFLAQTNLEVGTWYLARALQRWKDRDDPVPFALAEYNAGPGNVQRWLARCGSPCPAAQFLEHIGIASTRRYVQDVIAMQQRLERRGRL